LPHMSTRILSSAPTEASVFVWSLSWWPHALAHGLNPLFTHLAWAPTGLNLARSATAPIPTLLLAPLTLAFGPVVSFNVATLLAPAVSAWTAYLLCRRLARSFWPAIVGGAVFGFSPGLLVELKAGHLNLSMLFVHPQALKPPGFRGIALGLQRTKDLLLFVVPGHNTWIGSSLLGHASQASKDPWYLGLPLLAVVVYLLISRRRRVLVRVLAIGFLI